MLISQDSTIPIVSHEALLLKSQLTVMQQEICQSQSKQHTASMPTTMTMN